MKKPVRSRAWAEKKIELAISIMRRGWTKGVTCDESGYRCALGALYRAVTGRDTESTYTACRFFGVGSGSNYCAMKNDTAHTIEEAITATRPLMLDVLRGRYAIA